MIEWTQLPEFIRADRRRIEAEDQLRRARIRWIRLRRCGIAADMADTQAGIELAAHRVRVARREARVISRLCFRSLPAWQAVWAARDDS